MRWDGIYSFGDLVEMKNNVFNVCSDGGCSKQLRLDKLSIVIFKKQ